MTDKITSRYEPIPLPSLVPLTRDEAISRAQTFFQSLLTRHSIRHFSHQDVDQELIRTAIATAARAPSGANQQPWHFVAIQDAAMKERIRVAAEAEEQAFYDGGGGDEWIAALEPIGTGPHKPHLTDAPWLIVVFAQRYGLAEDGTRYKHYYVPESVGIATGFLVTALHNCGLSCLIHTPNPMSFLNELCHRPKNEKPMMIIPVGYPTAEAVIPKASLSKKPEQEILSFF